MNKFTDTLLSTGYFILGCMVIGNIDQNVQHFYQCVRAAADGIISGLVLLDLSAAFDLVEPSMLCEKLRIYGMDNDFLEWIASYLIGRQQAVWISHVRSKFKESYLGVPQSYNLL